MIVSAMRHLATPWIEPVSVDPRLFVNRSTDLRRAVRDLGDIVESGARSKLLVVAGERGVGKSIFMRTVLDKVRTAHDERVIALTVDCRNTGDRERLRRLAEKLADAVVDANMPEMEAWIQPLREMRLTDRITRATNTTAGREYGATGEAGAGLWGVLQAKFGVQWKERREQGQRVELSLDVTPELLTHAIAATLSHVADQKRTVIVLFDDLDQAAGMQSPESARQGLEAVVALPCVAILHLRNEVVFPDIRREVDAPIQLGPLVSGELEAILRHRLEAAQPKERDLLSTDAGWAPVAQLLRGTGNPLVFLRWLSALARGCDVWPPPKGWDSDEGLRRLALDALNGPQVSDGALMKLGVVVDAIGRSERITPEELHAGHHQLNPGASSAGLTETDLAHLEQHELLYRVNRFDPAMGLRLDPILELARPSVAARIRGA